MTHNIDPRTGLPEVPEGYFWRVKPSSGSYILVELRKKTWLGSTCVEWSVVRKDKASKYEIIFVAHYVMEKWHKVEPDLSHFYGDYPPKSL